MVRPSLGANLCETPPRDRLCMARASPMPEIIITAALLLLTGCLILPVVALVRTQRIRQPESRLAGVEAALLRLIQERQAQEIPYSTAAKRTVTRYDFFITLQAGAGYGYPSRFPLKSPLGRE